MCYLNLAEKVLYLWILMLFFDVYIINLKNIFRSDETFDFECLIKVRADKYKLKRIKAKYLRHVYD